MIHPRNSNLLRRATRLLTAATCSILALACRADEAPLLASVQESGESTPAAPAQDSLQALLDELGVRWSRADRELQIDGWINLTEGPLEVLACTSGGKTHESLLVLDCVPRGLHAGLLAIGLEPGAPARFEQDGSFTAPSGDGVVLFVRWSDAQGAAHEVRAESLVLGQNAGAPMPETAWIFTGSITTDSSDGATYAADAGANLITTFLDATSVLENPHGGGRNDEYYTAGVESSPPVGTPIVLLLRAAESSR